MRELNPHDLLCAVRLLPKQVRNQMITYGPRLVLGGGFVRSTVSGEKPNDIDLFTQTPEDAKQFAEEIAKGGKRKPYETGNALSVKLSARHFVQYIHRWTYSTPRALIESFDFTIACSALWFESGQWQSLIDDEFYSDLAAKRLVYRAPLRNEDAGGSMLRVLKFYQRGFRIPIDSLGAVIARLVNGVDLRGIEVLEGRDFSGMSSIGDTTEKRWAKIITGLLHEVDPQIDPDHLSHLPSSVETGGS
jgi:hypothetical protein